MLVNLLRLNQKQLYKYVINHIPEGFSVYHEKGKYLYVVHKEAKAFKLPLLTAHLDTVDEGSASFSHKDIVIQNSMIVLGSNKGNASCLGGDDRCGVWLMLELLKSNPLDYKFLFTFDEEIGGLGGSAFVDSTSFNEDYFTCYVSLDRRSPRGEPEAASYGYDNDNLFEIFKECGYQKAQGSFTDCLTLSESSNLACINLSVGYDNEHTPNEVIYLKSLYKTLEVLQLPEVVINLREVFKSSPSYVSKAASGYNWNGYDYDDDDDDDDLTVPTFSEVTCEFCGTHELLFKVNGYQLCSSCGIDEISPYSSISSDINN